MYNDFVQTNPSAASDETYDKTVSSQNISFTQLGQEECLLKPEMQFVVVSIPHWSPHCKQIR